MRTISDRQYRKEHLRNGVVPGSYRDPSGFVFCRDGRLYRQVNRRYAEQYDLLFTSGLYDALTQDGLLIPHREVSIPPEVAEIAYKIIEPESVRFISYPYEWCFSQLKDAALLTLQIQRTALAHGMTLKDCSAYNVQFHRGKPIFIDTLSFEAYHEGDIWRPYRQFCEHFLGQLGLMAFCDIRLHKFARAYLDGFPLDLVSKLLPFYTRLKLPWLLHVHLHARYQQQYADKAVGVPSERQMGQQSLLGLLDSLESAIRALQWEPKGTEWADYYTDTNYSKAGFRHKQQLITEFIEQANPQTIWDLGANNGCFSRLASKRHFFTVALDSDPAAVEQNYRFSKKDGDTCILPLILDVMNPSPGVGWDSRERASLLERGPADLGLALALIHHLAITHNVPFDKLAGFFSQVCRTLVIEFVPKHDSRVQRLLASREDIFTEYAQEEFERVFSRYFTICRSCQIQDSTRTLYLMERIAH